MAKILIIAGIVLIAAGIARLISERLGLGRLPGDFVIERGNMRIYLPIASSIAISVMLTLLLWLIGR